MPATKTQSAKCKTPFCSPKWEWNFTPTGGIPARSRCQSITEPGERDAGAKIVAEYRAQEEIAAINDIQTRQDQLGRVNGVPLELLSREIAGCDHDIWLSTQARLTELREEAKALMTPVIKRLIASFDEALNAATVDAERRIEEEGLPICDGNAWTLHTDGLCQALWFRRVKAEKLLEELDPRGAIGAIQFFLTQEEHTPFQWP